MNQKTIFSIFTILIAAVLIFVAGKYTEHTDQKNMFNLSQHIRSVPIPENITFAGERVPIEKFKVLERLDRELTINTFWQSSTLLILKKSKMYFNIIEPILKENGVPDDFKYLAVAESGLQDATSPSGAKGIWQFMPSAGQAYGLEINTAVDERYLLEKSTKAACLYLLEAYKKFGNWTLAAASYNRGMAGISNDMNKQLVTDFYDLHLNTETSRYLFRIIAYKAILEAPATYGYHLEDKDYYSEPETLILQADTAILNISEYAKSIGSNYHILKSLNPWILGNELPVTNGKIYKIKAPLKE